MSAAQPEPKPTRRGLWLAVVVVGGLLALTTWDAVRNSGGNSPTALRRAAFDGNEATVRHLIDAHPEWIDLPGSTNAQNPIFSGLYNKAMKALHGPPPSHTQRDPGQQFLELEGVGATSLWHALARTNIGIAKLLLEANASVQPNLKTGFPLICAAAMAGDTNLVSALEARGVKLDTPEPLARMTPLQYAVIGNNLSVLRFLVGRGINVNETNRWGYTALHYAANSDRYPMVQFLTTNGADWTHRTKAGLTALDMAWKNATDSSGSSDALVIATWLEAFTATNSPPTNLVP